MIDKTGAQLTGINKRADLVGRTFGNYTIIARLDQGASSEVFKGHHTTLDRFVAIKFLHPHLATAEDFIDRFKREASIVARLRHTNIMQVYDFDAVDGLNYLVMEFLDGPSLKTEILNRKEQNQPFKPSEIGHIASEIGLALDYAHARGVIHRDIKPANLMFNAEQQLILTDFGIVRIVGDSEFTATGNIIGTPAYMSPEQSMGQEVSPASDIYSFGIVLYELITGRLPFTADTAISLLMKHSREPVPAPSQFNKSVPPGLEAALLKALQKDPAERYQKASELAGDVRESIGMNPEQSPSLVSIPTISQSSTLHDSSSMSTSELEPDATIISTAILSDRPGGAATSPYRGLFAFREQDAENFFGREEVTEQLIAEVKKQPLVAVVGASGSGKSSVVFAGLVAYLRQSGAWTITSFRPNDEPFKSLAGALGPLLHPNLPGEQESEAVSQLAESLRSERGRLSEVLKEITNRLPDGQRLLLVADQFEEVFTLCKDTKLRYRFLDELLEAVDIQKFLDEQRFSLVITVRADFLGQALAYRPFATALQGADFKLGPMNRKELGRAIVNPARRRSVSFETGLALRIINDVGDEPGNLPLLEFALSSLWEMRQGDLITHTAYEEIGGVSGALARHASEVYDRLSPAEQTLARQALVQLVQPGEGTEDTRRLATKNELTPEEWQIAQKLADERLVVTGVNASGVETVEVVHEALIRNWGLLRDWMADDREFRIWQERLRSTMNQWQSSGRDKGALLRGALLQQALEWAEDDSVTLSTMEMTYIGHSLEEFERETKEKEEQRQRELEQTMALSESRRRQVVVVRWASVGLAVLLLLALFGAIFAFNQRGVAQANAREAEAQATAANVAQVTAVANEHIAATRAIEADNARQEAESAQAGAEIAQATAEAGQLEAERQRAEAVRQARLALSQSLASSAQATIEQTNDSELAALLAIEAANLNKSEQGNIEWYVDSALRPVVDQPYFNNTLLGHDGGVQSVAYSPDGRLLVSGATDNTVRIWNLAEPGSEAIVLEKHEAPVLAVAFSPDGQIIASGGEDKNIWLWDANDLDGEPRLLLGHDDQVLSLAFSPQGLLASSGLDGKVLLWDVTDLSPTPRTLVDQDRHILGLAFSKDGQTLALAGDDRSVKLLDVAIGNARTIGQHDSSVISVAFSPDQQSLASTSVDGTVRVWDLSGQGQDKVFRGHESRVRSVLFLPDGRRLVSASDDSTLRVWDLNDPSQAIAVLPGHGARVRNLALSPDGQTIASASDDQTIRLWRTSRSPDVDVTLTGHEANVLAVAFAPGKDIMFSSGADNNVRLWNTTNLEQEGVLSGHEGRVRALAYAPERQLLASGSDDNTIRLWDLNRLSDEPRVLQGHEGSIRGLTFTPDETRLFSAGDDGRVRIWNMEEPASPPELFNEVEDAIFYLAIAPAGNYLAAAGESGIIYLWDLTNPEGEARQLTGHDALVRSVVFSPDGRMLASASDDWTIRIWDMSNLEADPIVLTGHTAGARALAFAEDAQRLISTSTDQTVRIWNLANLMDQPSVLNGHQAAITGIAVAPDESFFATTSDDGTVRIWRFLDDLVASGCDLVGRNLTHAEWDALMGGEPYRATCSNQPVDQG